jgi:hypothetical protein
MPTKVTDVEILKAYIAGVMNRADHHANGVTEIALALVGAIVWAKDEEPIQVLTREGAMKNVLWVRINSVRYAFSYDHKTRSIGMHEGSTNGMLIYSFSNTTPVARVREIFESLQAAKSAAA